MKYPVCDFYIGDGESEVLHGLETRHNFVIVRTSIINIKS